jgi:hypothetical protein
LESKCACRRKVRFIFRVRFRGFHGGNCEEYRLLRYKDSSYLTGNTSSIHYTAQPVNAILTFEVFTAVTVKNALF